MRTSPTLSVKKSRSQSWGAWASDVGALTTAIASVPTKLKELPAVASDRANNTEVTAVIRTACPSEFLPTGYGSFNPHARPTGTNAKDTANPLTVHP